MHRRTHRLMPDTAVQAVPCSIGRWKAEQDRLSLPPGRADPAAIPLPHARTHKCLLVPPCPPAPLQVMGPPSQAHRLAALPDMVELNAWMLYAQVTAHTAPEAYAKARGVAVEAVLQREEFQRLGCLRHCDTINEALAALSTPQCAPEELLSGRAGGQ